MILLCRPAVAGTLELKMMVEGSQLSRLLFSAKGRAIGDLTFLRPAMNNFNGGAYNYNYGYGLQNALAGTLSNPYATQQNGGPSTGNFQQGVYFSSHYANAYNTMNAQGLGYTNLPSSSSHPSTQHALPRQSMPASHGSWYRPGSDRCRQPGCSFTGSAKSVEIHMMDRHLIYPPGHKKEKGGWDADPSLKGCVTNS